MRRSSGKEENAFYPPCSSGVYHYLLIVLNLTELIFGSLHKNEFCIMMSQNIGIKATGQRVSVAVFITKKICNLLCSVFIK